MGAILYEVSVTIPGQGMTVIMLQAISQAMATQMAESMFGKGTVNYARQAG